MIENVSISTLIGHVPIARAICENLSDNDLDSAILSSSHFSSIFSILSSNYWKNRAPKSCKIWRKIISRRKIENVAEYLRTWKHVAKIYNCKGK